MIALPRAQRQALAIAALFALLTFLAGMAGVLVR